MICNFFLFQEKKEEKEFKLPTGTVLHFKQDNEKMTRENIHEALVALGKTYNKSI